MPRRRTPLGSIFHNAVALVTSVCVASKALVAIAQRQFTPGTSDRPAKTAETSCEIDTKKAENKKTGAYKTATKEIRATADAVSSIYKEGPDTSTSIEAYTQPEDQSTIVQNVLPDAKTKEQEYHVCSCRAETHDWIGSVPGLTSGLPDTSLRGLTAPLTTFSNMMSLVDSVGGLVDLSVFLVWLVVCLRPSCQRFWGWLRNNKQDAEPTPTLHRRTTV